MLFKIQVIRISILMCPLLMYCIWKQVNGNASEDDVDREENVQVVLSGVDLLKLDDQTSQTDNHDKYIEVRKIMVF